MDGHWASSVLRNIIFVLLKSNVVVEVGMVTVVLVTPWRNSPIDF